MARSTGTEAHRNRILKAAFALLAQHGRDAVTTRMVAEAAKVQPPVLYRIFGDKTGLLDAVATYGFSAYLERKQPVGRDKDPVEALRTGWDLHVEFGLTNPELYLLMYAQPKPQAQSPAGRQSFEMLREHVQRVAAAGRLRVSVTRACALYHAAAVGLVLSLLASLPEDRDLSLSTAVRENALNGITTDAVNDLDPTVTTTANQLRVLLASTNEAMSAFTSAERLLLLEWLTRLTERNL